MASPVADAALQFRAQLLARDARRLAEMSRVYGTIWEGLRNSIADLERAMEAGEPERSIMQRLRDLQAQVERELTSYGAYADQQVLAGVQDAYGLAGRHAQSIVQAGYGPMGDAVIRSAWSRLPVEAIETMVGMLSDTSPLRHRMEERLGEAVAERVGAKLIEGIALGWGPRKTQTELRRTLGQGLEWSLTATRTATNWAYREGTRANYAANERIVKGWRWTAALQERTCMSCIAADGSVFPLDTPLKDHHNGRCTATPVLASYRELGIPMDGPDQTRPEGQQWFRNQPEAVQRAMMGETAYEEWRAGKFGVEDYITHYNDPVYGEMWREKTLKELV